MLYICTKGAPRRRRERAERYSERGVACTAGAQRRVAITAGPRRRGSGVTGPIAHRSSFSNSSSLYGLYLVAADLDLLPRLNRPY